MGVSMEDALPEDIADYTPVMFQGKPGFRRISTHPDGGFENLGQFTYDLVFERDDCWYKIIFHIFSDLQQLPSAILPYLESFRTHKHPKLQDIEREK